MPFWSKHKQDSRIAALLPSATSVAGIAMQVPPGSRPAQVLSHACIDGSKLEAATLTDIAYRLDAGRARWVVLLGHGDYLAMTLPAPPVPEAELEQALRWTIAEQLPYPPAQANLAWLKVPRLDRLPGKQAELQLFVTRRETVDYIAQLFKQARLDLAAVDVHETALRNIANLLPTAAESVALLSIGGPVISFTVTHQGELHYHRWLDHELDIRDPAIADQLIAERLLLQLQRTLDYLHRHLGYLLLKRLWLAHDGQRPALLELLRAGLSFPLELVEPGRLFDFGRTPQLCKPAVQVSVLPLLGACQRFTAAGNA